MTATTMLPVHEFTLVLNRAPGDDEIEMLYKAGLDDATVQRSPAPDFETGTSGSRNIGYIHVGRPRVSLRDALLSALNEVEAVPGLRVTAVHAEDLVRLSALALRSGHPEEFFRSAQAGRKAPNFPDPEIGNSYEDDALYSWRAVARWLAAYDHQPFDYDRWIKEADHLVQIRELLHDTEEREFWARILRSDTFRT